MAVKYAVGTKLKIEVRGLPDLVVTVTDERTEPGMVPTDYGQFAEHIVTEVLPEEQA
jgi:hypothetical protein